jgi:hypothetical protein
MHRYQAEWTEKWTDEGIEADRASAYHYYCRPCAKSNKLNNRGDIDIKQHVKSKKHIERKGGQHWTDRYNGEVGESSHYSLSIIRICSNSGDPSI